MLHNGLLAAIGNTPIVRLNRAIPNIHFRLFAKLEALNPGGSTKDRAAMSMLKEGIESGVIQPDTIVIESSSGNMGIGLAQACCYLGLRFICVADPAINTQTVHILKSYGAEINLVSTPDPTTGEFLPARITRVQLLLRSIKNSVWLNQYSNKFNALAYHAAMHEIMTDLDGQVDYLFCATSTCGTIRGCAEYIREHNLNTKLIAVDAVGSMIFDSKKAKRLIPGLGAGMRPPLFQPDLVESCIHVSDVDCIVGCRRLVRREGILAGGSSGGILMAIESAKHYINENAICVGIFPDRGERYIDTIYSDSWVHAHFGNAPEIFDEWSIEQYANLTDNLSYL
jgi:2,3-diaminopropionate biosynthesis protein SbnA